MNNIEDLIEKINLSFKDLEFEEKRHLYKANGKLLTSTSNMIKQFVPEFNEKEVAASYAKKNGIKVNDVLLEWKTKRDKATTNGTKVHLFAEKYIEDNSIIPTCRQEEAVKKFINDYIHSGKYSVITTELQMYSSKYKYAGTADLPLLDNETGDVIIADYKTNENLDKQYGYLLEPFAYTPNTPYSKYQIQLSYYQILLEQIVSNPIKRMIVWLKRDSNYEIRFCSDFTEILKKHLQLLLK
jgi:ABC-type transport system substrate-binding protein